MKTFKQIFDAHGLTLIEAKKRGVPYWALHKHYKGTRKVGAESAVLYEKLLGIPRCETRPDLWCCPKCLTDKCQKCLGEENEK